MFDTYGAPTVTSTERLRGYKSILYLADSPEVDAALQSIAPDGYRQIKVDPNYKDCGPEHCSNVLGTLKEMSANLPAAIVCRSGKRAAVLAKVHWLTSSSGQRREDEVATFLEGPEASSLPPAAKAWILAMTAAPPPASGSSAATTATAAVTAAPPPVVFRQLFDKETSTYTYLIADSASRDAIIIDPVDTLAERDAAIIKELNLNLVYGLNTHIHADHITGTAALKAVFPSCKSVLGASSKPAKADVYLEDGEALPFGARSITALFTPGHTEGCVSYVLDDRSRVFTGDTLFIRGCGRTDFQGGSAEALYDSVHSKLFALPKFTAVYPAHDYKGRTSSTVGEEEQLNPRLTKPKDDFVTLMAQLKLSTPKKIDVAVPANMRCGYPEE